MENNNGNNQSQNEIIDIEWEEDDAVIPYQYSITSYGADYPVESLVDRLIRDDIFIPHFQRDYVWSLKDASRFIETLLLGLPVPGLFLSKEKNSQKLLVIDGQQRLKSLLYFYLGNFEPNNRVFELNGVQEQYEGKTYKMLADEDRRKLNDSIIHLTIVQQDEPSEDNSSIYHIFERLNTTGRVLSPQEIRACLYHGKFNNLLRELNNYENWRVLYGSEVMHKRMRDQELLLRFFALYFRLDKYSKPMKGFLNKYMSYNRDLENESDELLKSIFFPTIDKILKDIGKTAFKPKRVLNAAVFDAIMVGVSKFISSPDHDINYDLNPAYKLLMNNEEFINAWENATTNEENVNKRIELSLSAFFSKKH